MAHGDGVVTDVAEAASTQVAPMLLIQSLPDSSVNVSTYGRQNYFRYNV